MSTRKLYEISHYFSSETQEMVLKVEEHNILDESGEIDETGIIIYNGPVFKESVKYEDLNKVLMFFSNNILGMNSRKCFTIDLGMVPILIHKLIDLGMIPILIHKLKEESYCETEKKLNIMSKAFKSIKL